MKNILNSLLLTFFIIISALIGNAQNKISIIPQPVNLKINQGVFHLNLKTVIIAQSASSLVSANLFNDYLEQYYGYKLIVKQESNQEKNAIILNYKAEVKKATYRISISENVVSIEGDEAGIFYAFQTLKQMITLGEGDKWLLPCAEITDYPTFDWRGMHLDVSRHFVGVDSVKKYIDYLALYKFNTFHWHLTDDQGWRIEIKKYPKLTQIGSFRNGTLIGAYSTSPRQYDSIRYGGFYTQEQIKEVVEYAAKRQIVIVPEIEMPGHALAALAAYPEFSCTGGPFEVSKLWGVFDDVFCAKEETFVFIKDVLTEVMDLFPGEYIHVGGDECPKTRWKKCDDCQAVIEREGLPDELTLQSYFISRAEAVINARGRKLIGWDEILEGGLAPNAAVMSWRGTEGGIEAAKMGHPVVMSPGSHCYFDHYQGSPLTEPHAIGGYTTLKKVYEYQPIPDELNQAERSFVLGAQANVWTEYMPNFKHIEYMIFPRMLALSEVLWSGSGNKNYDDFLQRVVVSFSLLDRIGANYSKAIYEVSASVLPIPNGVQVDFISAFPNTDIRYWLNSESAVYTFNKSIDITTNTTLHAAAFLNDSIQSSVYTQSFEISKSTGKKVTLKNTPSPSYNTGGAFTLVDGIVARIPWYGKEWLGFSGEDLVATVDLEKEEEISKLTMGFLLAETSWIYPPQSVEILISNDGENYTSIKKMNTDKMLSSKRFATFNFSPVKARFVKIIAKNAGIIPEHKPGAGHEAWLFIDEIQIK